MGSNADAVADPYDLQTKAKYEICLVGFINKKPASESDKYPHFRFEGDKTKLLENVLRESLPQANITAFEIYPDLSHKELNSCSSGAKGSKDIPAKFNTDHHATSTASHSESTVVLAPAPSTLQPIRRSSTLSDSALTTIDKHSLRDEALRLLRRLTNLPSLKDTFRSIVLVGYGLLGEVIIKQALMLANTLPQYSHIAVQTTDLVFLATSEPKAKDTMRWKELLTEAAREHSLTIAFTAPQSVQKLIFRFTNYHSKRYNVTNMYQVVSEMKNDDWYHDPDLNNLKQQTQDSRTPTTQLDKELHSEFYHPVLNGISRDIGVVYKRSAPLGRFAHVDPDNIEDIEYLAQLQACLGVFAILGFDGKDTRTTAGTGTGMPVLAGVKEIFQIRKKYRTILQALSPNKNLMFDLFEWQYGDRFPYNLEASIGTSSEIRGINSDGVVFAMSSALRDLKTNFAKPFSRPLSTCMLLLSSVERLRSEQLLVWEIAARQIIQGPTVVTTGFAVLQALLGVSGVNPRSGGPELLLRVFLHQILSQRPEVSPQMDFEYSAFYRDLESFWTEEILWRLLETVIACLPKHGLVVFFQDADKWFASYSNPEGEGFKFFERLRATTRSSQIGFSLFLSAEFSENYPGSWLSRLGNSLYPPEPTRPRQENEEPTSFTSAVPNLNPSTARQSEAEPTSAPDSDVDRIIATSISTTARVFRKCAAENQLLFAQVFFDSQALGDSIDNVDTTLALRYPLQALLNQAKFELSDESSVEGHCWEAYENNDLNELHQTLSHLRIIGNITGQSVNLVLSIAERMLRWACLAKRPLHFWELSLAAFSTLVCLDADPKLSMTENAIRKFPDMRHIDSCIKFVCFYLKPLIQFIDDGANERSKKVSDSTFLRASSDANGWCITAHREVQLMLDRATGGQSKEQASRKLKVGPIQLQNAGVAKVCIRYLQEYRNESLNSAFRELIGESTSRGDEFLDYAAKYWFIHYRSSFPRQREAVAVSATAPTHSAEAKESLDPAPSNTTSPSTPRSEPTGRPNESSDSDLYSGDPTPAGGDLDIATKDPDDATKAQTDNTTSSTNAQTASTPTHEGSGCDTTSTTQLASAAVKDTTFLKVDDAAEELKSHYRESLKYTTSEDLELDDIVVSFLQDEELRCLWHTTFLLGGYDSSKDPSAKEGSANDAAHLYDPALDKTGVEAASLLGLHWIVTKMLVGAESSDADGPLNSGGSMQSSLGRALEWAALNKHEEVVRVLIAFGCTATSTVLKILSIGNQTELVKLLLHIPRGNTGSTCTSTTESDSASAAADVSVLSTLRVEQALNWAAKAGSFEVVGELLSACTGTPTHCQHEYSKAPSPLMSAMPGVVEDVIDWELLIRSATLGGSRKVLDLALRRKLGCTGMCQELGRNLSASLTTKNSSLPYYYNLSKNSGTNLLMLAVQLGHKEIVRFLISEWKVNFFDGLDLSKSQKQLIYAMRGDLTIMELLLQQLPSDTPSITLDIALFERTVRFRTKHDELVAYRHAYPYAVHFLLSKRYKLPEPATVGSDTTVPVPLRAESNFTSVQTSGARYAFLIPANEAVKFGNLELLQLLKHHGLSFNSLAPSQSPIHIAASMGLTSIVRYLLQSSPGFASKQLRSRDTALATALGSSYYSSEVAACTGLVSTMACFFRYGGSPTLSPAEYGVILCLAVDSECYLLSRYLIVVKGATLVATSKILRDPRKHTWSPLFLAIYKKNHFLVHLLLWNELDAAKTEPMQSVSFRDRIGRTALHHAVMAGSEEIVQEVLANRTVRKRINVVDIHGQTALHIACTNGKLTQLLLENGASVSMTDRRRETPLEIAISERRTNRLAIHLLIKKEASILAASDSAMKKPEVFKPDRYQSLLCTAAKKGNSVSVDALCEEFPNLISTTTDSESGKITNVKHVEKAFKTAVKRGYLEVVRVLIKRGIFVDSENYRNGGTQLHRAAEENEFEMVRLLAEAGADIDKKEGEDSESDSDFPVTGPRTPLYIAAFAGNVECVRVLLEMKANANKYCGELLPLHVIPDEPKLVSLLVDKGGTDPNARTRGKNRTLLMEASVSGFVKVVRELVRRGVDVNITPGDATGKSALHYAAGCGNLEAAKEVMEILLRARADPNCKDNKGITPFEYAKSWYDRDSLLVVAGLFERYSDFEVTLEELDRSCMSIATRVDLGDPKSVASTGELAEKKCHSFLKADSERLGPGASTIPSSKVESWAKQRLPTLDNTRWIGTFKGKLLRAALHQVDSASAKDHGEITIAGNPTLQDIEIQIEMFLKVTPLGSQPKDLEPTASEKLPDQSESSFGSGPSPFAFSINGMMLYTKHKDFTTSGAPYEFRKAATKAEKKAEEKSESPGSKPEGDDSEASSGKQVQNVSTTEKVDDNTEAGVMVPDPRGWDAVKGSVRCLFWVDFEFRICPGHWVSGPPGVDKFFCTGVFKGKKSGANETLEPVDRIEGTWDMRMNGYFNGMLRDTSFTLTRDTGEAKGGSGDSDSVKDEPEGAV